MKTTNNKDANIEREAATRSRRAFLTMGAAAVTGYGGWAWLRSRSQVGDVEWPLRKVLGGNERIAEAWFSMAICHRPLVTPRWMQILARTEISGSRRTLTRPDGYLASGVLITRPSGK